MKKVFYSGFICLLLAACGQRGSDTSNAVTELPGSDAKVQVYYFHGKQRCVTCVTVQNVAQETIAEHFSGNNEVAFIEVDFSEKVNEPLAEKYEIVFSSLVIVSGDAHKDITDEAFPIVLRNPEGVKSMIIQEVNTFLNL